MNILSTIVFAAALAVTQHPSLPAGMSHEEHLKQLERDEALKKRGTVAMGFDQDAATHHFRLSASGGSIEVGIKDGAQSSTREQIREHLRSIADEFTRGDFGRPTATHAELPPGAAAMRKSKGRIQYRYEETETGGLVRIQTADRRALNAIHEFLRYQITEHKTGDRTSDPS